MEIHAANAPAAEGELEHQNSDGTAGAKPAEERVIIIAPIGQDATAMASLLRTHGFQVRVCQEPAESLDDISSGSGALLITEEVLEMRGAEDLFQSLKSQPAWSELPLIVLTSGGEPRLARLIDEAADSAGGITLLERPLGLNTLVRAVEGALKSRRRQYRVRDLLLEQQRSQNALRRSEAEFRDIAENISALVWISNPDGWTFFYNKRFFEYTGMTLEEMQGWGWQKIQDPAHLPRVMEKWRSHLKAGTPWEDTFPLRGKDGNYRWFLSRAFPLHDSDGKIVRWFGLSTDIHELRKTQEALHAAQAELLKHSATLEQTVEERTVKLRETVRELEAFSYSVAHDLRAPLRAMNSYAQLLKEDYAKALDDMGREYLNRISSSAARLDTLIQDVLSYTRIVRGPADLRPVDLDKLIREIIHSYPDLQPPRADIQIQGALPRVLGHEGFLTQCVSNLLGNAVKFVKPGEKPHVCISHHVKRGGDIVRISFEDNGIGIAPQNHNRVFNLFERVHSAAEYEGTGIGLSIVRKAVERMRGRVGFESELGKGSEFWIELLRIKD